VKLHAVQTLYKEVAGLGERVSQLERMMANVLDQLTTPKK